MFMYAPPMGCGPYTYTYQPAGKQLRYEAPIAWPHRIAFVRTKLQFVMRPVVFTGMVELAGKPVHELLDIFAARSGVEVTPEVKGALE